jgi:predicted esterase
MNRNIYKSASIFLTLIVITGVFDHVIQLWMGMDFVEERGWATRNSVKNWYIVEHIVSLAGAVFLIIYFHHKKYWISFWTAIIKALATVSLALVVCLLLLRYQELQSLYRPLMFGYLGAYLLFSLSLIFSEAGKLPWLKWAGILYGVATIAVLSRHLYLNDSGLLKSSTLESLNFAVTWISSLVPILFILNFLDESKRIKGEKQNDPKKPFSENWLNISSLICIGLTVGGGYNLFNVLNRDEQKEPSPYAIEVASSFLAKTYLSKQGEALNYRLLLPVNYDSNKKYPLVVCLHHGGAHGNDNVVQVDGSDIAKFLSKTENRIKYPAFLFVPQCPQFKYWGGIRNAANIDSLVFEAIASLEVTYSIDSKRRYVGGTSGGGFGTWYFISSRPGMFAAAIPMCSGGDTRSAFKLTRMPIWAFHGALDKMAPVQGTRQMIETINRRGGRHARYTEYPDGGHDIWKKVIGTPGLMDWLFDQKQ